MIDVEAYRALVASYGGIVSFAAAIGVSRKTAWSWGVGDAAPAVMIQRAINQLAARRKIGAPFPDAEVRHTTTEEVHHGETDERATRNKA